MAVVVGFWPVAASPAAANSPTLTAITAGSLPVISGRPIGLVMRSITGCSWPCSASRRRNPVHLALDPISPMLPSDGSRSAASQSAKSSAWSWRHDQHMRAARQHLEHLLPEQRVVHDDIGDPVGDVGQPELVELVLAGVDQVQPDGQPGQDPGQFVADVTDAEHRDHRPGRQWLQQQRHLAAAALPAVPVPGVLVEPGFLGFGFHRPGGDQFAGPADRGLLQVAAAHAAPAVVGADDHLGARVPGGVAAHLDHRHQHAR